MFWKKPKPNLVELERLVKEGAAIREMMQHPAGRIVEKRLDDEISWLRREWEMLLESVEPNIADKRYELYAYLRALELVKHIFIDRPKQGWRAEDKLLAFAERESKYN